ncbi:integrase catalytic domain-containing protein [Trichonephila clavipes]|nr:integrase catalytic domain-containing protein [Trichonephila clavipes]
MGDLPTHRVTHRQLIGTPSRPFSVCGVDYACLINILRYRDRGAKTTKGYIALFVCFATKALHLELVSDLISEAFIGSLKRFCARRGAPKHIYSDNGTTFVGARRKLLEIFKFVSKLNENEHFFYFLSQVNTEWHFNPPVSPHFGGLWEAGVKSIKYPLKRVIGITNLTFEEFSTLLTQIEAILNSRPLVSLDCDNDPDSLNILTRSHFLIGEVITSSPEHNNDNKLSLRSRWDIVQKVKKKSQSVVRTSRCPLGDWLVIVRGWTNPMVREMFLEKTHKEFILLSLRLVLSFGTIHPAAENALTVSTDVGGIFFKASRIPRVFGDD